MKAQTAAILHTESQAIRLQFMNVQMQAVGMTAASLLWHLLLHCHLESPHFAQEKMRHHRGAVLREGSTEN